MRCAGRLHLSVLIASQRIRPTPRYELPGGPAQLGHTLECPRSPQPRTYSLSR